jgi:hypothetical protein
LIGGIKNRCLALRYYFELAGFAGVAPSIRATALVRKLPRTQTWQYGTCDDLLLSCQLFFGYFLCVGGGLRDLAFKQSPDEY